jgi:multidrug efflux pump subunit AcrA (membrane-fusion protein)
MTMNKAFPIAVVVLLSIGFHGVAQTDSTPASDPVIEGAAVQVADQIKLPAKEPGVLIHVGVKEGSLVRAGQVIGKIDDREIQLQAKAAEYAFRGAVKKYNDKVDIQYADAGAAVAKADYEIMLEANKIREKAITEVDVRRAKLEWDKMTLAAEKARKEQELAQLDAYAKQAELDAAKLAIERRVIVAPFDGIVEEMSRKQDEWVNPGDTILRLFRMDTMNVEGAVDQKLYDPHELQGCKVTVEVQFARERKETVEGRITKVSSVVRYDGMFTVRAEVANRQEHGTWLLRHGLPATMTIHLGTGGSATESARRAP